MFHPKFLRAIGSIIPVRYKPFKKCLPGSWHSPVVTVLIVLSVLFLNSCVKRPFVPVNVGREYGNPKTPLVVSHAKEKNQWTLNRVEHHNIFQRALCFNYACRKMIGRSKTLQIISRKEFAKVIKRNAERGFFNTTPAPTVKDSRADTISTLPEKVIVPEKKIESDPIDPILKNDSLITLNEFLFETNSYKLKTDHYSELDALSNFLQAHPILLVSISGHTDSTGEERHNVTLSTRRAETVAEYLVGKGIDYERVVFKGLGSSQPIMKNDTEQGRSKNRRVEILISNPKK